MLNKKLIEKLKSEINELTDDKRYLKQDNTRKDINLKTANAGIKNLKDDLRTLEENYVIPALRKEIAKNRYSIRITTTREEAMRHDKTAFEVLESYLSIPLGGKPYIEKGCRGVYETLTRAKTHIKLMEEYNGT